MSKRLFYLLTLLVVATMVLAACAQPTEAPPPPEVTEVMEAPAAFECTDAIGCLDVAPGDPIHMAYAMVISGPDETLGVDTRNGVEIAIDTKGQVLGHDVLLTGEDEGCSAEGGQAAGTKLAADPTIVAVIGTNCSSAARVAVPLLSQSGFTIVSPSNTAPDLTLEGNPNNHPGYLRTAHSDLVQGAAAAKFAYEFKGATKAATIHDGSLYAEKLQEVFAEEFQKLGGTITAQEAVDPNATDFKSALTSIAANEPEFIYYPIFVKAGSLITRQAKETPGLENVFLMGADGMFSPDVVEGAGAAVEGLYVSSPDLSAFAADYQTDFLPKYQEKFGVDAPLSIFHAHAYDAAMLIFQAIEKVGVEDADGTLHIPRQALRDAMYATSGYQGLTGNLSCTPTGDCADPVIAVYEYHAGEFPPERIWPVDETPMALPETYDCADAIGCLEVAPGDPIHLAYAMVISGPDETLGVDTRNGVEIAIDTKGQVLGHDVLLTGEDEGCSAEGGQAAGTKLAADPTIVAVIGTNCSSAARVAVPLLSQSGFTIVSPSNTAPDLTLEGNPNNHPGYLRTAHSDLVQGAAAAKFAYEFKGATKAATIHDGSLYAEKLQEVFAEEFKKLGGTITAQEAVDPNATDFKSALTSIATTGPEFIYYPIFVKAGSLITRQAKETPGLENVFLMGADGMFSPDVVEGAGAAVEGLYVSSPDLSAFAADYQTDFLPKYQEKFGVDAPLSIFHAHAYDAAMLIFQAIEEVGVELADGTLFIPRQALRDAMYATSGYQGLTGNLSCTPTGDCADPVIAVYEYHDGEFPPERIWP